jgi:GPH family glycoside/pentoside/hexuronide:cation symporter
MTTTTPDPIGRLSKAECTAYGLGDAATNFVWGTLMVFLNYFYTDVFGLKPGDVVTLMVVCRLIDGFTDVGMGVLADRCNFRWGKFRPWVLGTAIPFGVLAVLTFSTPDFSYNSKLIYAYLTYVLLIVFFTANNVPYSAMTGVMTDDSTERTRLSTYRFVCAFGGAFVVKVFNGPMVEYFGQGNEALGYRLTMTVFAVIGVIFFFITFFGTKERVKPKPQGETDLIGELKDLLTNRPWLMLFVVGLCFVGVNTLRQSCTMYYFEYFLGNKAMAGTYLGITAVGGFFGVLLTPRLTSIWGSRKVVMGCTAVMGLASVAMYFVGRTGVVPATVLGTLTDMASGPVVVLFFARIADAAEFSEWKTGRRATGLFYSAGTLSFKFGSTIGGALTSYVLAQTGYIAGAVQTAEALGGIQLPMSLLPAAGCLIGFTAFWFYPLSEEKIAQIKADLAKRRATVEA